MVTEIAEPLESKLKLPCAHAAARVVRNVNVPLVAIKLAESSIGIEIAECTVALESVHVNRNVTPPVPGVPQAVPPSTKFQSIRYRPDWLQAPAAFAQRVVMLWAAVRLVSGKFGLGDECWRIFVQVAAPFGQTAKSCNVEFP